eukprot:gene2253-2025_t
MLEDARKTLMIEEDSFQISHSLVTKTKIPVCWKPAKHNDATHALLREQ